MAVFSVSTTIEASFSHQETSSQALALLSKLCNVEFPRSTMRLGGCCTATAVPIQLWDATCKRESNMGISANGDAPIKETGKKGQVVKYIGATSTHTAGVKSAATPRPEHAVNLDASLAPAQHMMAQNCQRLCPSQGRDDVFLIFYGR